MTTTTTRRSRCRIVPRPGKPNGPKVAPRTQRPEEPAVGLRRPRARGLCVRWSTASSDWTNVSTRKIADVSSGANPGTDSQFPAKCVGNLVSVPGLHGGCLRVSKLLRVAFHIGRGQRDQIL